MSETDTVAPQPTLTTKPALRIPRIPVVVWLALAALPALVPFIFILIYGVNVPFSDVWNPDVAGMFIKGHDGTLTLSDFFAQANEHRIAGPRLVIFILGWMTHWDTRAEMLFSWLCSCMTSLGLLRLIFDTSEGSIRSIAGRWFVCNLLVYSLAQFENYITGFGIINLLPTVFLVGSMIAAIRSRTSWIWLILAILMAAAATFSFGNGILAWPAAGLILVWPDTLRDLRARLPKAIAWAIGAIVCALLYKYHYVSPAQSPQIASIGDTLQYAMVFLGGPFAYSAGVATAAVPLAMALGILLLILLFLSVMYFALVVMRHDHTTAPRMIVWIALAIYPIASALLAGAFRARLGMLQASASRYVSYSLFLSIALANLIPLIFADLRARQTESQSWKPSLFRFAPPVLASLLILLILCAIPQETTEADLIRVDRRFCKGALLLSPIAPTNPTLWRIRFPDVNTLVSRALALDDLDLIRPKLIRTHDVADLIDRSRDVSKLNFGALEQMRQSGPAQVGILGWATLPGENCPADSVVLTLDDARGQPMIFAVAEMGVQRSDLVERFNDSHYLVSGWRAFVPYAAFDNGTKQPVIRAWALDSSTGHIFKLQGDTTIRRAE